MKDKKNILLIEDEEDILKTIKMELELEDFTVEAVTDGKEGLKKAREKVPDLIILDIMLPNMDGYKICKMLKFDKKYRDIPIIILSARAQEKDRELAIQSGANLFLNKPFEPEKLIKEINKFFHK